MIAMSQLMRTRRVYRFLLEGATNPAGRIRCNMGAGKQLRSSDSAWPWPNFKIAA
jgi:hypothetical protein